MDNEERMKEAFRQREQRERSHAACGGPSLHERVAYACDRAERQAHDLQKLRELHGLIEKYPEMARLIELLEWQRER